MRSLLVGNGINIQFDKQGCSSQQIVLNVLKNCNRFDFPSHIVVEQPFLLKHYLGELFLHARDILLGKKACFPTSSAERESLGAFIEKYSSKIKQLRIPDICFEDYYLLHDLLCHELHVNNPDMFFVREGMRMAYLFAIYNDGAINNLFSKYSSSFIEFLSSFDAIFSTNYDLNIEKATGKTVVHLHGQFDRLSDVYDPESLRNKLPDAPLQNTVIDHRFDYLYSNAITTHSGAYKEYIIKQNTTANSAVERMARVYNSESNTKAIVDNWINDDNPLIVNLSYAIRLKANNPNLHFSEQYDFERFEKITGTIELLGISPWNDFHIFRVINNAELERCVYYFNREKSCDKIIELLPNVSSKGRLVFKPASEIWEA